MFCSAFSGAVCSGVRNEYNDLKRVIDAAGCLFDEGYYDRSHSMFSFANKITI
jgi:hypothetical protein